MPTEAALLSAASTNGPTEATTSASTRVRPMALSVSPSWTRIEISPVPWPV
ncbi:hypothetical protein [Blastococcus brunescens]|uniref:Uncharacterized protein n=1 Tax=Blastococcus brunescens TaxID=1564165 RepID=A0ABZ1B972_9ACTN|nr:hypothetical protein [Blastococcus sp. BMG 8361]WRL67372.1 hypothetical protein U6N30_12385 [Blastococcus sp. BMG 8361]